MSNEWTKEELEKYIGSMKAITVPVNVAIEGKQKILDMAQLKKILESAEIISQSECYCRDKIGNCIEPMDGCLSIDDAARDDINKGAREITLDEALDAMKRTHDAGLVHMAYVFGDKDEPEVICSCCSCCCHSLSATVRLGYSDHVFESDFISTRNEDECENCGTCQERCQFHARVMVDEKLVYDPQKCFGCGVCVNTCPAGAIRLIERER